MSRNLEARIEKLEANAGSQLYGAWLGRQLAELGGHVGDKLEAMAKFLAGQPRRTHEEAVEAMAQEGQQR
jgi:hypothetical protein